LKAPSGPRQAVEGAQFGLLRLYPALTLSKTGWKSLAGG
jgi:hypothetical protein